MNLILIDLLQVSWLLQSMSCVTLLTLLTLVTWTCVVTGHMSSESLDTSEKIVSLEDSTQDEVSSLNYTRSRRQTVKEWNHLSLKSRICTCHEFLCTMTTQVVDIFLLRFYLLATYQPLVSSKYVDLMLFVISFLTLSMSVGLDIAPRY